VGVWRVSKAIVTGFAGTTCRHFRSVSLRRLCLTIVLAAITLSLPRLAAQRVTVGVVSAKGDVVDRVQIPENRTIVGFGPGGVVILAARHGTTTKLERARIK
jgi:hypothetical protein